MTGGESAVRKLNPEAARTVFTKSFNIANLSRSHLYNSVEEPLNEFFNSTGIDYQGLVLQFWRSVNLR
jgi:hypothetical protein